MSDKKKWSESYIPAPLEIPPTCPHEITLHGTIVEPEIAIQKARADAWKAIAGRLAADLRDELQGRERDNLKAFDALSKSEGGG